jgi:NAD(P)-dependent dehydrogenase (short-subunit alcohol dehydrogenase family)
LFAEVRKKEKSHLKVRDIPEDQLLCSYYLDLAIKESTGCQNIEVGIIDHGSFSSVIAFADKFKRDGGKIDILVANAAIVYPEYSTTEDGWETT